MYQKERMTKLLEIVSQKKIVTMSELEKLAFVSRSTLRRDLIQLEKENKIIRHFGQVELVSDLNVEFGYNIRMHDNEAEKKYIASIANDFIGDNQTLFIDSSSTTIRLFPYLQKHNQLVVITNGLHLATFLTEEPQIDTFLCGGHLNSRSGSILGGAAVDYLSNFRADLAFLSCEGFDEQGIYMASEEQAFLKRRMMELADQVILLCDTSKVAKKDYFRMCGHDQIDILITNQSLAPNLQAVLEKNHVEVLN